MTLMPQTLELVPPAEKFRDAYRLMIADFMTAREKPVPFVLTFDHTDFTAFLAQLDDCARGVDIPSGFVAHSTYFLVRNDHDVLGVANIRHTLTPSLHSEGGHIGYGICPAERRKGYGNAILHEALQCAAQLGLGKVLLTCAKTNLASAKIIIGNGGVLASEEYLAGRDEIVQRYWIDNHPALVASTG